MDWLPTLTDRSGPTYQRILDALADDIAVGRLRRGQQLPTHRALAKALVEMWQRRMELTFMFSVQQAFRHTHPAMKDWETPQIPEWGEANRPKALDFLALLDDELAERPFIAGDHYSIADITGLIGIDFMKPARITLPSDVANVRRWYEAVSSRPSARA